MIIGTTPTHFFKNQFKASEIKEVRILYAQDDELVVKKTTADCNIQDNLITVTLTETDTFKFDAKKPVEIQLRVVTTTNKVLNTVPERVGLTKCLDNEVIINVQ